MKTTIVQIPPPVIPFPKLMISTRTGAVILATGLTPNGIHGVIVHKAQSQHDVGYSYSGFSDSVVDFIGTLTIEGG